MQLPIMFGILMTMLYKDTVTAKQLAEKFEMSQRTIYRYVNALSESGIPLMSKMGRYGGWSVLPNYKLRSIYFTKEEYDKMIFNTTTSSVPDVTNANVLDKLQGLTRSISDQYVLRSNQLVVDTQAGEHVKDCLSTLQQAIEGRRLLEIEYHSLAGQIERRTIEPYSLVLKDRLWYVYCYCRLREDWRYFRVSRIADIMVQNNGYLPRMFSVDLSKIEDFATHGKQMVEVVLQVNKHCITAVEEWLGLGCVDFANGGNTVTANLPYDQWLVDKIIGLGSGVVVNSPMSLRQAVCDRCRDILSHYNS